MTFGEQSTQYIAFIPSYLWGTNCPCGEHRTKRENKGAPHMYMYNVCEVRPYAAGGGAGGGV